MISRYWGGASREPSPKRGRPTCPSPPPRSTPRCSTAPRPDGFAYPAINVTSSPDPQRRAARLRRGRQRRHRPGLHRRRRVPLRHAPSRTWSPAPSALAAYAHEVAKNYPVNIALHTDHCPKDKLDGFVRPLLAISPGAGRRAARTPLFQSHMWDGSAVPLDGEPRRSPTELLDQAAEAQHRSSRSRSASSAARRTASSARSTRSSTPPPRTPCHGRGARPRREGPLHAAPRPSATCTASTSRATSSCARRSSRRSRTRSAPSTARTSRSTWSSTAAPARCRRRSARRSTTAWSR